MIVGLGCMSPEQHIAIVMDGGDLHSSVEQERVRVSARRAPQRIEHDPQSGLLDRTEIHDFLQPRKVGWLYVERLRSGLTSVGVAFPCSNLRFNLLCHVGQRGSSIWSGKLNAVVLRRIMRGSK